MAEKWVLCGTNIASIFFHVFTLFQLPVVLSRSMLVETLGAFPNTSTLDVEDSIKKSFNPLSPKVKSSHYLQRQWEEKRQKSSQSESLILPLHNRASIHSLFQQHRHKDYKSLIESRLHRDSLRVKSLQARLDHVVNGTMKSYLKSLYGSLEAEALQGPVVSGTNQGSGEYFSRIGVGQPSKQVYVVLDTGSDVSWIQCEPCADCYQQSDPIFDPTLSSSYAPITCDSSQCQALDVSECQSHRCLYEVSYGDGSYTVGDFATETVTLDGASLDKVAIGCGHSNEGLFVGAAGLLGLGGGKLSFPAQINTTSFSYCLVDRDSESTSTLEFNTRVTPDAVTVKLLRNRELDTFYYLPLTGISIGGNLLSLPEASFQMDKSGDGGVIIDSGTAITRLQTDVYNGLRNAFVGGTQHLPTAEAVALFDTCYNLSSMSTVDIPSMALHFPDGKSVNLPAKNYMIPVDGVGTFCLALAPTTSSLSIIGNVQQQGTRVTFDLANSLVGFASNKC